MQQLVDFAREHELVLVHDFAYADLAFDGYTPPSIFEVPGAREVAVELYSLTKGFSLAGWRVAFVLGTPDVVGALARLEVLSRLRQLPAAADRRDRRAARGARAARGGRRDLPKAAATLCATGSRASAGTCRARGRRCSSGRAIPTLRELAQLSSRMRLLREAHVAVSPGIGFGADGEGYVRFALVENEQRIAQAVRGIRTALG